MSFEFIVIARPLSRSDDLAVDLSSCFFFSYNCISLDEIENDNNTHQTARIAGLNSFLFATLVVLWM